MPTPEIQIIEQDGQFQVVRSVPVTTYETTVVGTFSDRAMADLMADTLRAPVAPAAESEPVVEPPPEAKERAVRVRNRNPVSSAKERARAITMVREGASYEAVARELGRSPESVRGWCRSVGVKSQFQPGRPANGAGH